MNGSLTGTFMDGALGSLVAHVVIVEQQRNPDQSTAFVTAAEADAWPNNWGVNIQGVCANTS